MNVPVVSPRKPSSLPLPGPGRWSGCWSVPAAGALNPSRLICWACAGPAAAVTTRAHAAASRNPVLPHARICIAPFHTNRHSRRAGAYTGRRHGF
jgi:hypothetical protein